MSPDEDRAFNGHDRTMSAVPDPLTVHPSGPESIDRAEVVALDPMGAVVGRATLVRLYGLRGEVRFEQAPTTTVALALIDALEQEARLRGLSRLELDAGAASQRIATALRRWRDISVEPRGVRVHLTWPTTPPSP